jgi:ABC-2 type transport system permease protein
MYLLLLKRFCRSRMVTIGLFFVLLAGVASVFIGKAHLQKQQVSIAKAADLQQEHLVRNVQFFNKDMGLLFYYLRFGLVNETHPLNALSIGQRDVNSSLQNVNIRNLEAQLYDTDLFNPYGLLAGNLDFSFVLIYLFPLLIISFTYNLLSEEKEGSTWRLVLSQHDKPVNFLWKKLLVRVFVVLLALLFLLGIAVVVLSLPFDNALLAVAGLSIFYVFFWFALSFFIVSLKQNSGTGAVILATAWLLLTIVLPGAANNYLSARYEVPEALATMVKQRQGLHEKWDTEEGPTLEKFFAHYPQFSKYPRPDKKRGWLWYYAAQQMGDDESATDSKQLREKLWQRENASRQLAYLVPTLHTQFQLNNIAGSGLSNQLKFLDATAGFHEQLRLKFYPAIFEEMAVGQIDWKSLELEYFREDIKLSWQSAQLPLVVFSLLLVSAAWFNFRRNWKWEN